MHFVRHLSLVLLKSENKIVARQANLCLRAFRHDKFYLRMSSHSEGSGIWLSIWRFLLIQCLYERAAEVLARLRGCAGSPEPSLLAYAISTKFAWRGPINLLWNFSPLGCVIKHNNNCYKCLDNKFAKRLIFALEDWLRKCVVKTVFDTSFFWRQISIRKILAPW